MLLSRPMITRHSLFCRWPVYLLANFTPIYVKWYCVQKIRFAHWLWVNKAECSVSSSWMNRIEIPICPKKRSGPIACKRCWTHQNSIFMHFFRLIISFIGSFLLSVRESMCVFSLLLLNISSSTIFWWKNPISEWYLCIYVPKQCACPLHSVSKQFW